VSAMHKHHRGKAGDDSHRINLPALFKNDAQADPPA
jgi:hypothetical protein